MMPQECSRSLTAIFERAGPSPFSTTPGMASGRLSPELQVRHFCCTNSPGWEPTGRIRLMPSASLHDRIVVNPKICHGKPTIRGTRTPVAVVLGHIAGGDSFET